MSIETGIRNIKVLVETMLALSVCTAVVEIDVFSVGLRTARVTDIIKTSD